MRREQINVKQFMWLLINERIFHSAMFLMSVTSTDVGRDAWISEIFAALGGVGLLWLVSALVLRFPRQSIIEYAPKVVGTLPGKLVGFLYIWFCLHLVMITFRDFGELVTSIVMPETPIEVVMAVLAIAVGYGVKRGIEVIARVNEFFLPISIGTMVFIVGAVAKDMDLRSLKPILEKGLALPMIGAATPFALFGVDVAVTTMLVPLVDRPEGTRRAATAAFLIDGILGLLMTTAVLAVFGAQEARRLNFPVYELVRMISIGDFLERIDVLVLGIWINMVFVKAAVFFYLGTVSMARWFNLRDYRPLVTPLGVLMVALSLRLFDNLPDLVAFFKPRVMLPYTLPVAFVVPVFILVITLIRGQRGATR